MSDPIVQHVTLGEDWAGVYVDGSLAYEGHSIPTWVWLKAFNDYDIKAGTEHIENDPDAPDGLLGLPHRYIDLHPLTEDE